MLSATHRLISGILFAIICLYCKSLQAGDGWVSSGSDLLKDRHNPWWIQNTQKVTYCVKVDSNTFSNSQDSLHNVVEQALAYWRESFKATFSLESSQFYGYQLGTQALIRIECSSEVGLTFIFGNGALTEPQAKFVAQFGNQVAVAVRTSYDPVHLKAQGFIFVRSDSGPNSLAANPSLIPQPWSPGKEGLLQRILIHELGHVYGLQHSDLAVRGRLSSAQMMAPNIADYILNRWSASLYYNLEFSKNLYFRVEPLFKICQLSKSQKKFFGLNAHQECLESWKISTKPEEYQVGIQADNLILGTLELQHFVPPFRTVPIGQLFISKDQSVFIPDPDNTHVPPLLDYIEGPVLPIGMRTYRWLPFSGSELDHHLITFDFQQRYFSAYVVQQNGIEELFSTFPAK